MKELYRKTYGLDIVVPFFMFKKTLEFEFQEGTMNELQEVAEVVSGEDKEKKLSIWLFDFLNKSGKIPKKQFSGLTSNMVEQIIANILKNWGGGYFDKTGKKGTSNAPESSVICFVLGKSNETVSSLLSLTWRQLNFIISGIVWNENEKTKEGKIENLRNMKGNTDLDALERIRKFEKKL